MRPFQEGGEVVVKVSRVEVSPEEPATEDTATTRTDEGNTGITSRIHAIACYWRSRCKVHITK